MYKLLEEHGKEKLSKLCRKCGKKNLYGIDYLKAFLEDDDPKEEATTDQEELTLTGLPNQTEVDRSMETYERLAKGGGS